jgi:MOSC domain-containing protein YiiM
MSSQNGKVYSVHVGVHDDLSKEARSSITLALDGIEGDRHRSFQRKAFAGDKQPRGTFRRNERQWSAMSVEEIRQIADHMQLADTLTAESLGVNLCLEGIPNLSRLPRGTVLKFTSGVELMVEEYNPPCAEMGEKLASMHRTKSGESVAPTAFSKAAKFCRGIVGVVEVAGVIKAGDSVIVEPHILPKWLRGESA